MDGQTTPRPKKRSSSKSRSPVSVERRRSLKHSVDARFLSGALLVSLAPGTSLERVVDKIQTALEDADLGGYNFEIVGSSGNRLGPRSVGWDFEDQVTVVILAVF